MPDQRFTMSDALLMETRSRPPANLEDAEGLMLGSARIRKGSAVSVYWEMYGLKAGERPYISVAVTQERSGVLATVRRIAGRGRSPLVDRWSVGFSDAEASGLDAEPRAVELNLSALATGRYTLSIRLQLEGHQPVESTRVIEIVGK